MNQIQKTICLSTVLTLILAVGSVAVGFTGFVQAEIKDDLESLHNQEMINREKITNLQITNAEMNGKLTLILEKLEAKMMN